MARKEIFGPGVKLRGIIIRIIVGCVTYRRDECVCACEGVAPLASGHFGQELPLSQQSPTFRALPFSDD